MKCHKNFNGNNVNVIYQKSLIIVSAQIHTKIEEYFYDTNN